MKKIILLFAGAVGIFILLSFMDEYENVILPFFAGKNSDNIYLVKEDEGVKVALRDFNNTLTKAYLSADPSLLKSATIDMGLYSGIADEISYLAREGKIMDMKISDIAVKKIETLSPGFLRVNTGEKVGLRYLSLADKKELVVYADAWHDMVYMIAMKDGKWRVVSYETRGIIRQD